jgi:hypothetical protein
MRALAIGLLSSRIAEKALGKVMFVIVVSFGASALE